MLDVVFKSSEAGESDDLPVNITELWIPGLGGVDTDKCFLVSRISPSYWKVDGYIEPPPADEEDECILKGEGKEDVERIHLGGARPGGDTLPLPRGQVKECPCVLESIQFWDVVFIPFDPLTQPTNSLPYDVILQLSTINYSRIEGVGLNKAITTVRSAADLSCNGDPSYPNRLCELGFLLHSRQKLSEDLQGVSEGISFPRKLVQLTPEGHPDFPSRRHRLGLTFRSRYELTSDLDDLPQAMSAARKAVDLSPLTGGHTDLSLFYSNLGSSFHDRFKRTGDVSDITEAVSAMRQAVDLAPVGHRGLCARLSDLGRLSEIRLEVLHDVGGISDAIAAQQKTDLGASLHTRFESSGDLEDLTRVVAPQRKDVDVSPNDHPGLPSFLDDLGGALHVQYTRTGNLEDITEAVSSQRRAVDLAPDGHRHLPTYTNGLGESSSVRFGSSGKFEGITEAVSSQHGAVDPSPNDPLDKLTFFDNLSASLCTRFEEIGSIEVITEAVLSQRRVVNLTPEDNPSLHVCLNTHSCCLLKRFHRIGNLEDITEVISVQRRAVRPTHDDHADLPWWINDLSNSLLNRFQRTGDLGDITEAIEEQRKAVRLTPDDHAHLPRYLSNLGLFLSRRAEHTGNLDDIEEAIPVQRRAVRLTANGHARLPLWINSLSISLANRFRRAGDLGDITEAIEEQRKAVRLTPDDHVDLPRHLSNLGLYLSRRAEHTGSLDDIEEAIPVQRRAVRLTTNDHADLPLWINSLSISLANRFERTGDLGDITEAIEEQRKAVRLTPDDHALLPKYLSNLGRYLSHRATHTGNLDDIEEAIPVQRRAVRLTTDGHARLPSRINNLGFSLVNRFQRTGDLGDITEAIEEQRKAVRLTPDDHVRLPRYLSNLGRFLRHRAEWTNDLEDLRSEAIPALQKTLLLTADGHAELPRYLSNFGDLLRRSFGHTNNPEDITQGILAQERAVKLTPEGHANLPSWLTKLAESLATRYLSTGNPQDLDACISNYTVAASSAVGGPHTRLAAAVQWARLLRQFDPESPEILSAFDTALSLSSTLVVGLQQTIERRYSVLQEYATLPLEAASTAFHRQQPDKALEWLEQGRCLVWGQITILRSPMDGLRIHNAVLAERIVNVSNQLERAGSSMQQIRNNMDPSVKISLENEARAHIQLAREWDDLLAKARDIPGFQDFLRPLRCPAVMKHLPVSSAVVVVNVYNDRCDAIALVAGSDKPLHIPLPKFTLEKAKRYRTTLNIQLNSQGLRTRASDTTTEDDVCLSERVAGPYQRLTKLEGGVCMVLRGLWEEVVKPILKAAGIFISKSSDASNGALPRVWWCPTGPLSFLPIHAAGIYRGAEVESIMDYVVSSYTPTVTALTQRVKADRRIEDGVSGLFLTSQPKAPGAVTIAGTTREVTSIYTKATRYGTRVVKLDGDAVSAEECLEYMERFSSIHLACHASQNAAEPLQSRFRFHKGHLDIATIMQKNLKNADLAFLSACETSTGEETLSDEAVHLAAGMLAAGYRRVVATMWAIKDSHAPQVSDDFYEYLWTHKEEGSGTGFDGTKSAHALHHAIQQLRERLGNADRSLLTWIPYVHFGY